MATLAFGSLCFQTSSLLENFLSWNSRAERNLEAFLVHLYHFIERSENPKNFQKLLDRTGFASESYIP